MVGGDRTFSKRRVNMGVKVENSRVESSVMAVKELSVYLRIHPSTVYRELKRGRLPAFKVGSDWRFNIEQIDLWCLEQDKRGG
jgi:excisionase family DNA binding protein